MAPPYHPGERMLIENRQGYALQPVARLRTAGVVGACSPLKLDLTASVNQGSKTFAAGNGAAECEFYLSGLEPGNNTHYNEVNNWLSDAWPSCQPVIPAGLLRPGTRYRLEVEVGGWDGGEDYVMFEVNQTATPMPRLLAAPNAPATQLSSQPLVLAADLASDPCVPPAVAAAPRSYSWKLIVARPMEVLVCSYARSHS